MRLYPRTGHLRRLVSPASEHRRGTDQLGALNPSGVHVGEVFGRRIVENGRPHNVTTLSPTVTPTPDLPTAPGRVHNRTAPLYPLTAMTITIEQKHNN